MYVFPKAHSLPHTIHTNVFKKNDLRSAWLRILSVDAASYWVDHTAAIEGIFWRSQDLVEANTHPSPPPSGRDGAMTFRCQLRPDQTRSHNWRRCHIKPHHPGGRLQSVWKMASCLNRKRAGDINRKKKKPSRGSGVYAGRKRRHWFASECASSDLHFARVTVQASSRMSSPRDPHLVDQTGSAGKMGEKMLHCHYTQHTCKTKKRDLKVMPSHCIFFF